VKCFLSLLLVCLASGCATVVNGTHQQVAVDSDPPGARVRVDCGDAARDPGTTPVTVELQRAAEHCSLTLTKAGYSEETVVFERQLSKVVNANQAAGAVAGTFLGLVGLLAGLDSSDASGKGAQAGWEVGSELGPLPGYAIDNRTGAAFKQVPGKVSVRLQPLVASSDGN
jgi:hypothetical protein